MPKNETLFQVLKKINEASSDVVFQFKDHQHIKTIWQIKL